jgi:hypothetical protein
MTKLNFRRSKNIDSELKSLLFQEFELSNFNEFKFTNDMLQNCRKLILVNCSNSKLPDNLPKCTELQIEHCNYLTLPSLPKCTELQIEHCNYLTLPNLPDCKKLTLELCFNLKLPNNLPNCVEFIL